MEVNLLVGVLGDSSGLSGSGRGSMSWLVSNLSLNVLASCLEEWAVAKEVLLVTEMTSVIGRRVARAGF